MFSLPNVGPRPGCQRERRPWYSLEMGRCRHTSIIDENTRALGDNIPYRVQHINARTPRGRSERLPCSARSQEQKLKVPFLPHSQMVHVAIFALEVAVSKKLKKGVVYAGALTERERERERERDLLLHS